MYCTDADTICRSEVEKDSRYDGYPYNICCLTVGYEEPNNDPNFGGEDCTIKWNDGTTWNDVPCDFTYPCYCQDVKGGGY